MLLIIFVETVINLFIYLRKFMKYKSFVTMQTSFDQFITSLLNKSINNKKKSYLKF